MVSKNNQKVTTKETEKETEYDCHFIFMCPALAKCRMGGVFTRKNTDMCACRDLKKCQ